MTSVQLPSSLRNIDNFAFSETNITTVTIPEGVISIGDSCFYRCKSLTSVQLPSTLRSIGDWAFYDKKNNRVTIPIFCDSKKAFDGSCKIIYK